MQKRGLRIFGVLLFNGFEFTMFLASDAKPNSTTSPSYGNPARRQG
ncbi:hypothetical protein Fuma_02142 [Fuerstiella marisgermanici]|uniref:Uncharacterized protein n=1 Tax=Fuerstiella marisgermanici TaxID=1891926 RepID=A0A1P8WEQ2_9PLAN|nr:hypothetical protein Fuma_02142 [Fuerstiella marisgermanici]